MTTGDKLATVVLAVGAIVAGFAHYGAQRDCSASKKPTTDVTAKRSVRPFTGEYERRNGVLYCLDSDGILHKFKER